MLALLLLTSTCLAMFDFVVGTIQGGLVDVRYGQVSIDTGGSSTVLDLPADASVTLDGQAIKADDLQKRIPEGLTAVATYHQNDGSITALETYSGGRGIPAANVTLLPTKAVYKAGETVTILLSKEEVMRLGVPDKLRIPGLPALPPGLLRSPHNLKSILTDNDFLPAQRGGYKAVLRTPSSNLIDLPVLLKIGEKVYRGPRISVAATTPVITGKGPHVASSKLDTIPGWVDLCYPPSLLDLSSARLSVSSGARIVKFQPRVDRSVFELQADGPGEYWLEFSVADVLGRTVKERWPLRVLP